MPEWIARLTVEQIILALGAIAAVWAGFAKVRNSFQPLVEMAHMFKQFIEDWNGKPARVDPITDDELEPAVPGVLSRVAGLEKHMAAVRHQVKNHHETNLRDDVDGVMNSLKKLAEAFDKHVLETADRRQKADLLTRTVHDDILPVAQRLGEQLRPES